MQLPANLADLVARYQKPGPRYTSYPSALHFRDNLPAEDLLAPTRAATAPLSLYFHLPFCEKLCWFCGCHTIITRDKARADDYLDLLTREIELTVPHLQPGREVHQLHFGGGTPNFLTPAQIERLGAALRRHFTFAPDAENSVELAPAHLERAHVQAFRALGINRASFGIQDCNPAVQAAIHRLQPAELNLEVAGWLRAEGFRSLNIDLIYGLPRQTPDTFRATLDHALAIQPDRIALFGYAHVPWVKPAQKYLEKAGLPTGPERLELFRLALETLTANGYIFIGLDHFARAGDELARAQEAGTLHRNFQGYSTRSGLELLALGLSSISQSPGGYRQNAKDLRQYRSALQAGRLPLERGLLLTADDHRRARLIQDVMCRLRVVFSDHAGPEGLPFQTHYATALEQLEAFAADGLVALTPDGFSVTPLGRLFIRNIALLFDAYQAPREQAYSKTL